MTNAPIACIYKSYLYWAHEFPKGIPANSVPLFAAEPARELVAWGVDWGLDRAGERPCVSIIKRLPDGDTKVLAVEYGPQRPWVGLTDEDLRKICVSEWGGYEQARAVEAKLKERNT